MIHLIAVKIGKRKWAVIPSDVQDVREKIYLTVKKRLEDKLAEKESGRERRDNATKGTSQE